MPRSRLVLSPAFRTLFASIVVTCAADASAQSAPPPEHPPEYMEFELTAVNIGVTFAGHLGRGFYTGAGFSVLPSLSVNTFSEYPIEVGDLHLFVRYEPIRQIQLDGGARVSLFQDFQLCILAPCASAATGMLVGPYLGAAFGPPVFKVGPRVEYAVETNTGKTGALFYPLYLRWDIVLAP
jgi:hypothetical protein